MKQPINLGITCGIVGIFLLGFSLSVQSIPTIQNKTPSVQSVPDLKSTPQGQKLPVTAQVAIGAEIIMLEVARTSQEQSTGLMYRTDLAKDRGMLFVFSPARPVSFWMKNTLIPLSVAYLADDGVIVNIEDMKPHSEQSHCAKVPVRFALEMNQGWFAGKGLKPGAKLRGLERFRPR